MKIVRILKWFFGILFGLVVMISVLLAIFKDDIINLVVEELNKNLKVPVNVEKIDLAFWGSFPNLSVDFKNVFVKDAYIGSTEKDTLLFTERIRLKFNPLDIWRENYTLKSIEINPGTLQLKVTRDGEINYDILKEQRDSMQSEKFEVNLKKVKLTDFRFSYSNEATEQIYKTAINEMSVSGAFNNDQFTAHTKSVMKIIAAKSGNVQLVKNKIARLNLALNVNKNTGSITIPPSAILITNLPFTFDGKITSEEYKFNLKANDINLQDVANNVLTDQTRDINKFEGTGKLLFNLAVSGKNDSKSASQINCRFGIKNGYLKEPESGLSLNSIKLDGTYSNENDSEILQLDNVAFVTKGGPFKGNVALTNFKSPIYNGHATGSLNLSVLNTFLQLNTFEQIYGNADLSADFTVLTSIGESNTTNYAIDKCDGFVKFHNANFSLINDKRLFKDINGIFYLRGNNAGAENVSLEIGNSDFNVNGVFKNISEYLNKTGNLQADVEISSKNINVSDLGTESKESKESKSQSERTFVLPNNIDASVFLDVKKLVYEGHHFSRLMGNMSISKRLIHFPNLKVTNGGTEISGSLSIHEENPEKFLISSQILSNAINLNKIFTEWNDFQQSVITKDNISGDAQANVAFQALFDFRTGINARSIIAQIGIQIDNGRLKNVSTLKSITESLRTSGIRLAIGKENIADLERKLSDLKFNQLKNTLLIKDGVLTIPSMSIESSALDMEASGKHTFENKVDYRFGFRFRDLKSPKESEFGEIVDDGTGIRVFMHMYGDLNNPTIEWDKLSRKETAKQNRDAAKQDAKSILKSEFGLFKNDTTVKTYIQSKQPKENLQIHFDPVHDIDTLIDSKKPKKDGKVNKWLKEMKEESDKDKREHFVIGE